MTSTPLPGQHGGDVERIARHLGVDPSSLLDLSASLNPLATDVQVLAATRLEALARYPDAQRAETILAEAMGVEPERLLLTNGGAEGIALLRDEIGGRVIEPEFSLYPRGCPDAPLWRSNPHNPSGRLAPIDETADVWDEAFFPLATGQWTRHDDGVQAVVGSLTKLFACPGLRLGYAIGDPVRIGRLRRKQPQWSVNGLALALLPDLLERADLPGWAAGIAELRRQLVAILGAHGLAPEPSDANYLLCSAPEGFRAALLGQGIIVRDCNSFGLADRVRIAVPGADGLERLSGALDVVTR
jgi:histidinol-phosphate/aromatic aminotransferase/cobyric acid decarboxylase-like protein